MNYDEQLIGELFKLSHLTEDKEHLSKTIHEAAVRLEEMADIHRKYALQRVTREQMGEDYWAWQGDGEDHIESMSESVVVKITAGDLKAIIDPAKIAYQIEWGNTDGFDDTMESCEDELVYPPGLTVIDEHNIKNVFDYLKSRGMDHNELVTLLPHLLASTIDEVLEKYHEENSFERAMTGV